MRYILAIAFFLTACGGGSGAGITNPPPKPPTGGASGDPSLLFTNNLDSSWVYITWQDGQGVAGRDSVPPRTASQCVRFLARPDSAKWAITAHEHGVLSTQTAPWFDPASRPAWSVVVSSAGEGGSPIMIVKDIDPALAC